MTESSPGYGMLASAGDAFIMDDGLPPLAETVKASPVTTDGNALSSYRQENRINGVPVAPEDRNLKIGQEDLLNAAFELKRRPRSVLLYMSPENTESQEAYNALLDRVYSGEAVIVDEIKQFDATGCRFVVWVRYDELVYRLHPRFEYLREE